MLVTIALTAIALFAGVFIAVINRPVSVISRLMSGFAGGIALYYSGTLIAGLVSQAENIAGSSTAVPSTTSLAGFLIVAAVGLVVLPVFVVFILRLRRFSFVLALAFGTLSLSIGLSVGSDQAAGIITATSLVIVLLAIRYLLIGLGAGGALMQRKVGAAELIAIGLVMTIPAIAGAFIPASPILDLVRILADSAAAGFLIFAIPFIVSAPHDERHVSSQFAGILLGFASIAVVEALIPILAK